MLTYQVQVHFSNKGQYNFLYTLDNGEDIDDLLCKYESQEGWALTGDENSSALVNLAHVSAIMAFPYHEPEQSDKIYKIGQNNAT